MNKSGTLNTVLRALPLVVLDIMSTFAAFIVGTWGMNLEGQIFGMDALGWHIALLAVINVAVLAAFQCQRVGPGVALSIAAFKMGVCKKIFWEHEVLPAYEGICEGLVILA